MDGDEEFKAKGNRGIDSEIKPQKRGQIKEQREMIAEVNDRDECFLRKSYGV